MVFPRVCTMVFSLKHCGYAVLCSSGKAGTTGQLITYLLSCSTCLFRPRWQPREGVVGLIKNAFCASCSSSSNAHVAVE